ncbi:g2824 [Coccomyxa elongata]
MVSNLVADFKQHFLGARAHRLDQSRESEQAARQRLEDEIRETERLVNENQELRKLVRSTQTLLVQPQQTTFPLRSHATDALQVVLGEQSTSVESHAQLRRSTNSFRTTLFGQVKRVPGEEIIDAVSTATDRVRVHSLSSFRRYWDLTAIALTIHTVLVLPFRAAFFWDYYRELEAHHTILEQLQVDWMLATELFIDLFFLSDIVLNFNTGYIADQVLVMERHLVGRHYLRTWFALDLIASVPMDLLLRGRRFDILCLPRLLKVIRIMHYRTLTQTVHDLRRTPIVSSISRFHIQIL